MNRASIVSDNVQSFINQNTPSQDFTGAPSSFASFDVVQPAPIGTPPQVQLLKALGDFYTSDRDKDARKRAMDAFGSSLPSLSDPSTDAFVGRKVVSSAGYVGNPMAFLHDHAQKLGLQMPEGISSDMQAYSLIGNHIRSVALKDYEARLQQQKEVQKAQDKLMEMNGDQWAALINGDDIREKKFFATIGHLDATSQGKWVDTLGKARAAMNIISNWQKEGGMTSDAKSVLGKSFTGLKENMDKADYEQLARAESRRSLYELTAKQYAALFDSLSTTAEDGTKTLDEAALALFRFALSREMRDQQRISGDFWGSFTDGLRGLWNETEDFFRNPDTPLLMQGAVGLATQALQGMDETYIRSNPDYIKLRDIIYNAEDEGTDISKDATFLAQALAKSGNIVGESLPATLAGIGATIATGGLGAAAGIAAWAGAASTIAPSAINAAVRSNIAEGNSNPWLTGVVQGGAQAAAEGIFGIIPGGGKATQFLLRVGAKTPLAGRVLAKAQSNALARFFFSGTTESIGEISEDVIADFGSNLGLNLMREVGIDISAPNADALANLSETLEDPAQITAMVGYCFTLGLVGMGADSVKARTFARNYDNLKAAGFSRENAAYISQRAEEISNRIAEVQSNPETSESAKTTIIDALEKDFQQEQQNLFKKDVLEQDPSVLLKRAKENKKELMSQREAALLTASGARDAALAKMGVLQEPKPLANGKYLLTFQTQKPDGTPEETKVEWTDQQLTDWVQLQNDNIYAQAMRQYQSWLTGAALAQSPLAIEDAEQAKTQLLNLGVAPTAAFNDAFADLAKRGTIDAPFVQKLSNLANAEINAFMEAGMTREQASQQPSAYIPGVATGTLANLQQATRQRVAAAAQTTEGKTIGITQENATFPAIRLNAIDGGSVVAFIAGDISPLQFSEDMWEAKLVNQVNSGKLTWTQLEDQLKKAEAELRRINPAISILPKKDSLSRQDIIEGYSTLQTADFITNHKHYPLSQNTHTLLDTVIRGSQAVRAAQLIGEAWKNVDKSDIDTSLSDLLRDAGMQMGAIFDSAKVDAQVRQAVWERRGVTESLEQRVQAVIDEYNAEQQEIRDNPPEPAGTPQPIPAEESVTGEAIPAEDPLARADNNPETGDFNIPSMPTQQDERGRGLKDNKYAETGNGSVIGMVDPNTVKPCPEVQQFKTIDTAAGRTEAREDGTVRDLPGKWNPLADPIFILRRKNGELQVISGRHRLAHAKKNGAKYIKAEVWDESEKFDIAWARRQDVAHNILQGTANATDIAVFFRGNPITYEEADALGFIQKRKDGEDTCASKMGITVALHASEEIYTRLINGQISDSTAFQLAALFPDNERQQLEALDLRESGQSWTSIAWYVNSDPDSFIPDGLTQGNLFGVDENEGRKKLAEYVGKVEKHITSLIGIIEKGKSIQRRAKIARELDFNFSTDTDLVDTLTLLRDLKYAYQHPHKGELEDVKRKAAQWDGKSPVEPTLSELIGEAKLLVPYSTAEAAPAEATETMDDLFSSMAIGASDDFAAEVKSIKERAMKDGTFMKAPNGKPSNLTEPQWLAVRTRAFKRWFGVWDIAGNDVAIIETEPIRENNKHAGLSLAERLGLIRLMSNEETGGKGEINISRSSINKMLTMDGNAEKDISAVKYAALPHLHEIIKESVFAETHPDHKKGVNGERSPENGINPDLDIDILYGALSFNGRTYRVKTTLKRYADKNKKTKAYTYDVTEIEVLPGTLDGAGTARSPQRKTSISTDILLKGVKNVNGNLTLDDFSKVLDENGEPLAVYHGTREEFSEFDIGMAGFYSKSDYAPVGFWFSGTPGFGRRFSGSFSGKAIKGSREMSIFLNLRNPKVFDFSSNVDSYRQFQADVISSFGMDADSVGATWRRGSHVLSAPERWKAAQEYRQKLQAEGYDGIIIRDTTYDSDTAGGINTQYVAFEPNQIKSATENRGTFDADNADITLAISTSNPDDIAAQYANARKGSLAHRMMTHASAEANRFRRVLRKPTTDAEAAQDLASVLIFMESAMRYVPSVHLPRMTAKRNALEAYIKMMQQGRIGVNRNGTIRRSGLTQEQINAVAEQAAAAYEEAVARQDILPENKLTKEEAKKLQRDFIRAAARDNIGTTIASIYDDIASSIATALSDKLIDRMHARIGQLQPKVSANRKPLEAKVRPDAFREVGEISRVMQLSQADFEKEQEALYAEMNNEDNTPERAAELDRKFALLRTYGALRSRTYAEVQAAYTDLMAYIATERHLWQDILEQRNQQINEDLQNFYNKVSPEKGDAYNRQRGREKLETLFGRLGGYWRELQSPSQLFLALSGHEALKGIAKRTLDGIANANAAILGAEHRRETAMLSAYARIFGIKPLGRDGQYTEKQLHKLRNGSFADFTQDILKIRKTGITRRYTDDATGNEVAVEIEASDSQLMNLILTAEQDDYKGNAEKWGYTDDIIAAVKNHLGSRKLAFAYALRSVLQSDNLPKIFEERKGLLMPENPNYWPGHLDLTRLSQQESAALINNYSKGGTYGMLRNRVANNYDFALADVLSVFQAACAQRNNFIYMEPITTPWRRMLSHAPFATRLEGLIGATNYRLVSSILDALDGAGASEGFMQASVNKFLSPFLSSYAKAVLAGSPTTLMRQVDAVMHGALMENTNAVQISKQILLDRLGKGKMNYASIMELPAFKHRYRGDAAYEDLIRSGANAQWSTLGNWMRTGMSALEKVDVFCNAISGCALYNVTYNRLTEENQKNGGELTEEEIQKLCEQEVTNMLELTAQPLRKTQKSAFSLLAKNGLAEACTFLGSETINKVGYAIARYGQVYAQTGSRTKAFGAYMRPMATMGAAGTLVSIAISFLRTGLAGDDADKADWLLFFGKEFFLGLSGVDALSGIPILGDVFNFRTSFNKGWNLPGKTEWDVAVKIFDMATDNRDHSASEYFNQTVKLTRALATSSGMLSSYRSSYGTAVTVASALLGSLTTAMNVVYPFTQGIERGAIWSADWLGLESKKQRQARERRRKAILRQLSRTRSTRSVPTRYNLAL